MYKPDVLRWTVFFWNQKQCISRPCCTCQPKNPKVATCTFGKCRKGFERQERFQKCRKGFRNAGKVLEMQERFCKLVGKVLKMWERFYRREKVGKLSKFQERFQNDNFEAGKGRKGKGKESFQSLPNLPLGFFKTMRKIAQIFVTFSEKLNFMHLVFLSYL